MVNFEIFVKSMTASLLELKVTPSFCFAFKIPDDVTATIIYNPNSQPSYSKAFMLVLFILSNHSLIIHLR